MHIIKTFFLAAFILSSCTKQSSLQKEFSCDKNKPFEEVEKIYDFQKRFSIDVPKNWKTSLYYDDSQTEIFCADTILPYEETYLMEFSHVNGKIKIDEALKEEVHNMTMQSKIEFVKDGFLQFDDKKSYYFIGKIDEKTNKKHIFLFYLLLSEYNYFLVNTQFYGNQNFENKLCESFNIINSLHFYPE